MTFSFVNMQHLLNFWTKVTERPRDQHTRIVIRVIRWRLRHGQSRSCHQTGIFLQARPIRGGWLARVGQKNSHATGGGGHARRGPTESSGWHLQCGVSLPCTCNKQAHVHTQSHQQRYFTSRLSHDPEIIYTGIIDQQSNLHKLTF